MAQTSYPFDVGAGAGFANSAAFRALSLRWRGSGVNKGDRNGLAVAAGAGLQTTVASGSAFVRGAYYDNDASLTLSHTAADATFGRLDLVCLELDLSDLNAPLVEAVVVTGTPSGSPVLPSMTQNSTIYQIPLAQVAVAALATSVGTITDLRPWAGYRPRLVDGNAGGTATTSSTTYADMTTMDSGQFYSDGGDIEVMFTSSVWSNTGGGSLQIGVALDGGTEVYLGTINSSDANYAQQFSSRHLFESVAAGFHRLKIRWLSGSGAHVANANNSRRMIYAEVA